MAIAAVWLWTLVIPSEEVTRVRSGLIFDMGDSADFGWGPEAIPATFLAETGAVSTEFQMAADSAVAKLPASRGDFDVALALARSLMTVPKRIGGPIKSDLLTTLRAIENDGRGYCADFAKVYNGIAIAAGLPVRQWGFAFNSFGSGHTFNEIYDRARKKWLVIDSFHSLYFVDPATRVPLSALELHDRLLSLNDAPSEIAIERIVPAHYPFRSDVVALDYYRRGMTQLYLVWGNNVFDYEKKLGYKLASPFGRSAEEITAIATGRYPRMRIYPIAVSDRDVDELQLHRTRLMLAASALILATLLFVVQALRLRKSR
jgi:hypothetical protein